MSYIRGWFPPGHCSPPFGNCSRGNSDVEPLIVIHNMLISHAKAVKLYRDQFQVSNLFNTYFIPKLLRSIYLYLKVKVYQFYLYIHIHKQFSDILLESFQRVFLKISLLSLIL